MARAWIQRVGANGLHKISTGIDAKTYRTTLN